MNLKIRPAEIPDDGLVLQGATESDIFQLAESSIIPATPVNYDLAARLDGDLLIVTGSVSAGFQLQCVRCLEFFPFEVRIGDLLVEEPVENRDVIDLTDRIREDILLDLPGYPRCETSNLEDRVCPAASLFKEGAAVNDNPEPTSGEAQGNHVWDVLDDLSKKDRRSSSSS